MKVKCDHCGHVYPVKAVPNNKEGFFITKRNAQLLLTVEQPTMRSIERLSIPCTRCPKCKEISVV